MWTPQRDPSPKYAVMRLLKWFTASVTWVNPHLDNCMMTTSRMEYFPPKGTRGLGMRVV